jgi:hypothetical protein
VGRESREDGEVQPPPLMRKDGAEARTDDLDVRHDDSSVR